MTFLAVPPFRLIKTKRPLPPATAEEMLKPSAEMTAAMVADALRGAEFRGERAFDRVERIEAAGEEHQIYAAPPNDLPALLRLADQLLTLAKQQATGELTRVWACDCGCRFAVPVAYVRPLSLRCERCGRTVELEVGKSIGEERASDPGQHHVNAARVALSEFFREAMARGWVVLVGSA